MPEIVAAMKQELVLQKNFLGSLPITTVYFGGGTPSLLSATQVCEFLDIIATHYDCSSLEEVTLEANPEDLTLSFLQSLYQGGVNRLSIGIQTFHDRFLKALNRSHTGRVALDALTNAVTAGFKNFSIDLMYGLPEDTMERWEQDLEQALQISPCHISSYCLTVEPKTFFGEVKKRGALLLPKEGLVKEQFTWALHCLEEQGYLHYEISNFCKPPFFSVHNTNYWLNVPYLGIGPGAHSYNGEDYQSNVANNRLYLLALRENRMAVKRELLQETDRANIYIMTALRTMWGVDLSLLETRYKVCLQEVHLSSLKLFKEKNLIKMGSNRIFLTQSGKLLADAITQELFV